MRKLYLRSVNFETYHQEVKKSTLSIFDDKRCFIRDIKSEPCNYYYYMAVKVKESFEKTRHVKNNDKSKEKHILRGQRMVRYHERVLSNKNKTQRHVH